ncbi:MAG: hypothetical protein Q7R35_00250 [Elusimicrobiota bacterium]|nr:hypothetical protein [Elusimicrobiota bacterium]
MKYWAYVNNEILGPFEKEKLLELPSFSPSLLVCPQTPVGEKTEDWKESSTYPELSALAGGARSPAAARETFAPAPAVQENPAPAAEPEKQNLIGITSLGFKPLHASQQLEQVPPAEHSSGINIAVNRLGKAGPEPAAISQPHQASSSFDPISLSHIERRSETISSEETPGTAQPPAAAEGIALEPQRAFPQPTAWNEQPQLGEQKLPPVMPAAEAEPISFTPAAALPPIIESFSRPAAAEAPVIENFSRPASSAPSPAVADMAGLESLIQRLDSLARTSATRQDLNSAVDPLRVKLDQMGEVISSIKNSQFQHEVMGKLVYLENAVGELKVAFRGPPSGRIQKVEVEKNSDTVFGIPPVKQAEKANPFAGGVAKAPAHQAAKLEPAEAVKPTKITDTGSSKGSTIVPMLKKVFKLIVTLVLLVAVLLGAVIMMKNLGVFDATKFIPFPLPFTGAKPAQQEPAAEFEQKTPAQQPEQKETPPPAGEQKPEQPQAIKDQAQQKAAQQDAAATPEIIFITRTYKLKPAGQILESKIDAHSAKAGGNYSRVKWEVRPASEEGTFEIDAIIPAKTGSLTYTFLVDRAKKSVSPSNEDGKAAFNALAGDAAKKPSAKNPAKQKAAVKPAAKPKKAAGKKKVAPEEEYEYVEEDESE